MDQDLRCSARAALCGARDACMHVPTPRTVSRRAPFAASGFPAICELFAPPRTQPRGRIYASRLLPRARVGRPSRLEISSPDQSDSATRVPALSPVTGSLRRIESPHYRAGAGKRSDLEIAARDGHTTPFVRGCREKPWRACWIACKGGFRKPPPRPSNAAGPSRAHSARRL